MLVEDLVVNQIRLTPVPLAGQHGLVASSGKRAFLGRGQTLSQFDREFLEDSSKTRDRA